MQIGIVVPSVDAAAGNFATLLGITDWNINYVDTDNGKGRNFRVGGEDVAVKAKIAWATIGDIELDHVRARAVGCIVGRFEGFTE